MIVEYSSNSLGIIGKYPSQNSRFDPLMVCKNGEKQVDQTSTSSFRPYPERLEIWVPQVVIFVS